MTQTRRASRLRAAAVGLAALPLVAACASADGTEKTTLTFAAIPAESSDSLESDYSNITELLAQELDVEVKFQNASDYAAVIEGQRAGQIDIASYGPFSYVIAKDSGVDIEAVAAPSDAEDVAPAYTSLAYVREDSDIQDLADLEGKKVCYVDVASTSGYLVPMEGLLGEDLSVEEDTEAIIAGGHDASLLSLDSGACDAAFAHNAMHDTLVRTGQLEEGALRPVWESEAIPEDPIAVNLATVDEDLAEDIARVLREKANKPALVEAGICETEEDCTLPESTEYGYLTVDDSDFDSIREICEATEADACKSID